MPIMSAPVNSSDRFEIHRYCLVIDDLRQRLAAVEMAGAVALGVARRLHHLARTFPRVAAGVKRIARLAG